MKPDESDITPTGSAQGVQTNPQYQNLTIKELIEFLVIDVLFFSLGYLIAHFILTGPLLVLAAQRTPDWTPQNTEFAASILNNLSTQLLCCLPSALPIALVIGGFTLLLRRFAKTTRFVLIAIFAFTGGFVIEIPFQILNFIAAVM
jgi:hypothetical protein